MLLLGDPSTAKSQFLKFASKTVRNRFSFQRITIGHVSPGENLQAQCERAACPAWQTLPMKSLRSAIVQHTLSCWNPGSTVPVTVRTVEAAIHDHRRRLQCTRRARAPARRV